MTSFVNPYMGLVLDGLLAEGQKLGATVVVDLDGFGTPGGSAGLTLTVA